MNSLKIVAPLALILSIGATQTVLAAPHETGLNACKTATLEAVGNAEIRLSDLNRRGKIYDFWLDVFVAGSSDDTRMRAFCKVKGRSVIDLVTEDGVWNKSTKREVAKQSTLRIASK